MTRLGIPLAAALLAAALAGCGPKAPSPHAGHAAAGAPPTAAPKFHCPMHPTYTSDRPGTCPICGMDLVPVEQDGGSHTGGVTAVEGRTTIGLSAERRQLIGLTSEPVSRKALSRTVRAPATIEIAETRRVKVSPRIGGWIRELYADFPGKTVRKGEPLLKLYSPELLATQSDYLAALRTGNPAVIAAAKRRLELWDIGEAQIADLEKTARPSDTMILAAPAGGQIVQKEAVQGQAFMAGETLFEIADLGRVWVRAFLYEQEAAQVRVGQPALVELAYANRSYDAKVDFIQPTVDERSRTIEVRLEVDNPGLELKPGMWATVEIEQEIGEVLAAPASAILETGRRFVAFVDRPDGHLEPRVVRIGARTEDDWEIRSGLAEGERVVTRALFLVDSESQLKAALAGMGSAGGHEH
jgi:Cu(I)/Ag(I) efflux system membrane fusion protein